MIKGCWRNSVTRLVVNQKITGANPVHPVFKKELIMINSCPS